MVRACKPAAEAWPKDDQITELKSWFDNFDQERDAALVQAIASILWQAGQNKRAVVILRKGGALCTSKTFESGLLKFNFTDKVSLVDFLTVRCPMCILLRFLI